jgi:hypothetical protein
LGVIGRGFSGSKKAQSLTREQFFQPAIVISKLQLKAFKHELSSGLVAM